MDEVLPGLDDGQLWPQWMSRRETSEYLRQRHGIKMGPAGLANAAVDGTGPPFSKDGGVRVVYWRPDVDDWARTRKSRRVRSTSELRHRAGGQPAEAAAADQTT
jgi:hypothetical protein